jgi:hypothetical protein
LDIRKSIYSNGGTDIQNPSKKSSTLPISAVHDSSLTSLTDPGSIPSIVDIRGVTEKMGGIQSKLMK